MRFMRVISDNRGYIYSAMCLIAACGFGYGMTAYLGLTGLFIVSFINGMLLAFICSK